jgi:hypothetical protein
MWTPRSSRVMIWATAGRCSQATGPSRAATTWRMFTASPGSTTPPSRWCGGGAPHAPRRCPHAPRLTRAPALRPTSIGRPHVPIVTRPAFQSAASATTSLAGSLMSLGARASAESPARPLPRNLTFPDKRGQRVLADPGRRTRSFKGEPRSGRALASGSASVALRRQGAAPPRSYTGMADRLQDMRRR